MQQLNRNRRFLTENSTINFCSRHCQNWCRVCSCARDRTRVRACVRARVGFRRLINLVHYPIARGLCRYSALLGEKRAHLPVFWSFWQLTGVEGTRKDAESTSCRALPSSPLLGHPRRAHCRRQGERKGRHFHSSPPTANTGPPPGLAGPSPDGITFRGSDYDVIG